VLAEKGDIPVRLSIGSWAASGTDTEGHLLAAYRTTACSYLIS